MKRVKRIKAVELRRRGNSVSEIANMLSVSKSTASVWVRGVDISPIAQERILRRMSSARLAAPETHKKNRILRETTALGAAADLFSGGEILTQYQYILAALIYECEGAKNSRSTLEFTNSDPVLVKIFLSLMRRSWMLDESKFRVVMHLHSYHDEDVERKFWSKATGIPEVQFYKTYQKRESGNVRKSEYRGCVQIKYFDVNIKRMLLAGKLLMAKKLGL